MHVKDTFPGQLRYVEPGTGKVPFEEAFAKIAEIGYQGPVVLELWTEDFPDAVEQVRKGFAFIKQQMVKGWDLFAARNQP